MARSRCHGGICRALTRSLMARAHGRTCPYVSNDMGAAVPGRWQLWQERWSNGSTSFVNVGASASVAAATGAGLPDDTRQRKQTDNGDDSLHNCLRYLARVLRTRGGHTGRVKLSKVSIASGCRCHATGFAWAGGCVLRGHHADHISRRRARGSRDLATWSSAAAHASSSTAAGSKGDVSGTSAIERRSRSTPATIDAVVLSHAHIDHSGRPPLLRKHGYRGPIFTTATTARLLEIMLADSGHI